MDELPQEVQDKLIAAQAAKTDLAAKKSARSAADEALAAAQADDAAKIQAETTSTQALASAKEELVAAVERHFSP